MAADEAAAAGDENPHGRPILFRRGEAFEAGAKAFAPVGEARRVFALAAKDGVGGPRRRAAELRGRDRHDAAFHPGLVEDRLCELGPCALAVGRDVPDRPAGGRQSPGPRRRDARRRSGSRVGRRPRSLRPAPVRARASCGRSSCPVGPKSQELRTIQPAPSRPLSLELGLPVHGERPRLVGLDVRRSLVSVEDVVRREVHDRDAERGDVPRALDVHTARGRPGRPRRRRHPSTPQRGARAPASRASRFGDIEPRESASASGQKLAQRRPELPTGARDEDARVPLREDRRSGCSTGRLTRGSSQGIPCSSGSAGSYSSVTW